MHLVKPTVKTNNIFLFLFNVCHSESRSFCSLSLLFIVLYVFISIGFTNILNSCLQESHTQNLSSIAFPAVGTGDLGYPRDMVAEEMCNSIINFSKENPKTSLKKVVFVAYERDTQTIEVHLIFNQSVCLPVCNFTYTAKISCLILKNDNKITCFYMS